MKRAIAGGFTAIILLTGVARSADEPSKTAPTTTSGAGVVENPGWKFKLTPNSEPLFAEPSGPANAAPPFAIQLNSRMKRKGQGEPTFTELPRVWWIGDYLTPLEKSHRVIPRSDRVRE